jgi:hypothetical protein
MPLRNQFETEAEWLEHLRIWLAAHALPIVFSEARSQPGYDRCYTEVLVSVAAEWAYATADAMIAERAKEQ